MINLKQVIKLALTLIITVLIPLTSFYGIRFIKPYTFVDPQWEKLTEPASKFISMSTQQREEEKEKIAAWAKETSQYYDNVLMPRVQASINQFRTFYFYTSFCIGLIFILLGALVMPLPFLQAGCILGGTLTLITGYPHAWDYFSDLTQLLSLLAALLLLFMLRIIQPSEKIPAIALGLAIGFLIPLTTFYATRVISPEPTRPSIFSENLIETAQNASKQKHESLLNEHWYSTDYLGIEIWPSITAKSFTERDQNATQQEHEEFNKKNRLSQEEWHEYEAAQNRYRLAYLGIHIFIGFIIISLGLFVIPANFLGATFVLSGFITLAAGYLYHVVPLSNLTQLLSLLAVFFILFLLRLMGSFKGIRAAVFYVGIVFLILFTLTFATLQYQKQYSPNLDDTQNTIES